MHGDNSRCYSAFAKRLGVLKQRRTKDIETVDCDECAGQLPPLSGGWIFHFVQSQVQILDHVSVTVPITLTPGVQEVIGRLPH